MHNKPLVTILMPVYNGAPYIKEAINSILAQTYPNFELLIINDGSTDNTEAIIKSYNDSRIKYHYHSNRGVSRSLNKGLELTKGEYIRRHDADDISLPDALEKQVSFIQKHPEYPLIGNSISFMTQNGKIAHKYKNPTKQFFKNNNFVEVNKDNYWEHRSIIHATVLAKKEIFEKAGGYRTEFPTAEDIDLWFRILENHNAAILNEVNYFVRLHGTSNTHVHGSKNTFYRDLAYLFFKERATKGTDPLMRGESMPVPPTEDIEKKQQEDNRLASQHRLFRADILNFQYRVFVNAKDWKLVLQSIKISLKDGWKLKQTWKGIIFPLLGDELVQIGVKIKSIFK